MRWEHILGIALDALEEAPHDLERARSALRHLHELGAAAYVEEAADEVWAYGRVWPGIPPQIRPPCSHGAFVVGNDEHGHELFLGRLLGGEVYAIERFERRRGDVVELEWWSSTGDPEWRQSALHVPDERRARIAIAELTAWVRELPYMPTGARASAGRTRAAHEVLCRARPESTRPMPP